MANICDMNLYIVAETGDDMKSLLETMADNFKKVTNVNLLENIGEYADWRLCAQAMERGSGSYNKLCFLSEDPDSRSEYGSFNGMITSGRPCVCVSMGLKWGPSNQVASFCNSLDSSKFGFACINGGEYMCAMGDEIAFIQWGAPFGDPFDGGHDFDEFIAEKRTVLSAAPTTLHEMALCALFSRENAGTYFWEHSDDYDDYDASGAGGYEYLDLPPVNWSNPTESDVSKILSAVVEVAASLPLIVGVEKGWTKAGVQAVEAMLPGDVVAVVGEWESIGPSELKVMTLDGVQIGFPWSWMRIVEDYEVDRIAHGVLALMLPHIRATVYELTPVSLRNTGIEGPDLRIRLDMEEVEFTALREEVREMLEKPYFERSLSSDIEEAM